MNENLTNLLNKFGSSVIFKKDSTLFHEGDTCNGMLLVTEGSIKVIKYSENGKEALLYRVNPDNVCILSLSCLIGNNLYNAEGIAETEIHGIYIPHHNFLELLNSNSNFREFIFKNFAERISDFIKKLDDIIFKTVKERLIDFLNSPQYHKNLTHQEMAIELGTSREVITRMLKSIESDGLLKKD